MTINQLVQSSPANANELFAKLAATGNGAVKTRENLFSDLKAELELHSRLEEEHLFPVLKKHKETKELVRAAIEDNKQTRALLSELEEMPKEGEEFLPKLAELRKAFQKHVRDEKKELLPAVKTALSNEEAQGITERVEADKAALEEANASRPKSNAQLLGRSARRRNDARLSPRPGSSAPAKRRSVSRLRSAPRSAGFARKRNSVSRKSKLKSAEPVKPRQPWRKRAKTSSGAANRLRPLAAPPCRLVARRRSGTRSKWQA